MRRISRQTAPGGVFPSIGSVIAFLILCSWTAPALSQEQRCLDLINDGDSTTFCGCSEPMDVFQAIADNGDTDFNDSPNLTECSNLTNNPNPLGLGANYSLNHSSGTPGTTLAISTDRRIGDMVAIGTVNTALPGVSYVLQVSNSPQSQQVAGDLVYADYEFTNATICARKYVHINNIEWYVPGYTYDGNQDLKWGRNEAGHTGDTPEVETVMTADTAHPSGWWPATPGPGNFGATSPAISLSHSWSDAATNPVSFETYQTAWVRQEICYDHNESHHTANRLQYRARAVRLDTGAVEQYPARLSTASSADVWSGSKSQFIEWGMPDWITPPNPPPNSTIYVSHAMVAFKSPADETFWIGPAYEIEGGRPDPTPAAPQAPVLLP